MSDRAAQSAKRHIDCWHHVCFYIAISSHCTVLKHCLNFFHFTVFRKKLHWMSLSKRIAWLIRKLHSIFLILNHIFDSMLSFFFYLCARLCIYLVASCFTYVLLHLIPKVDILQLSSRFFGEVDSVVVCIIVYI